MSFQSLKVAELREVAEFFNIDVTTADPTQEATKKELIAALAADEEPVTWKQYNDIFLPAMELEKSAQVEKNIEPDVVVEQPKKVVDPNQKTVLVKYGRPNPTFEILGFTFTTRHPFASVPEDVAEHLIRNVTGFRLALQSEVTDYYG